MWICSSEQKIDHILIIKDYEEFHEITNNMDYRKKELM